MDGPEYGRRPYDEWTGGSRERRPLFLWLIVILHGIWFLITAAGIAAGSVTGLLDSGSFSFGFGDIGVLRPLYIIAAACFGISLVLLDYFLTLCVTALWALICRKMMRWPKRAKNRPESAMSWDRMPLMLKFLIAYGIVFLVVVIIGAGYITWVTAEGCFGDSTGAGPLIGIFAVPMFFVLGGMAIGAVATFTGCLVPGWVFAGRLLEYIRDTLGIPRRRDGGEL